MMVDLACHGDASAVASALAGRIKTVDSYIYQGYIDTEVSDNDGAHGFEVLWIRCKMS